MKGNSALASAKLLMQKRIDLEEQTATFDKAEMGYIMFCAMAVFLITPGIALFYGGALKRKSMVQLLFQSYMVTATITILWYLIGYSLANSPSSTSVMIGDVAHAALHSEEAWPLLEGGTIPSIVNFCFNTFFPIATVQIFVGSIGERGRILPSLVIGIVFTLVVYCPQAYWVWSGNGWLYTLGELDFAGGGPVHVSSGVASLVYSWYLGPRGSPGKKTGKIPVYRGHSTMTTMVGVTLIWGAWLCFNSGTLLAINARTGYIFANTMLAAAWASVSYVATDKILTGKYSMDAACEGVIVGLVNITPSCGYYWPWATAVTSVIDGIACRLLVGFNKWTGIDDYSKSWVVHGIGGIIGGTLTGIFASRDVAGLDGVTVIEGGWIDGNFRQLGIQIAAWVSITLWTGVFTGIICFIVDHIPGLKIRASAEGEEMGMDLYEMAETLDEFGNNYDEFLLQYADKLRSMADSIEKSSGMIEVIDGSSPRNSHSSIRVDIHQKV